MDYKKRDVKKVKVIKAPKPKKVKKQEVRKTEQIKMQKKTSASLKDTERKPRQTPPLFKKFDGRTLKLQKEHKKSVIISSIAIILILVVVLLQLLTPTGLFDYIQNTVASFGGGKGMPISVTGNRADGIYSSGDIIYALTDTSMYAYNLSGKEVSSVQHGFVNPAVVNHSQRTLIYDRGNTGYRVDSLYRNHVVGATEEKIFTADLSQSGRLAIATDAKKSASVLTVYEKNYSKALMEYSSAKDRIATVKLSPNGRYVAFTTTAIEEGQKTSSLKIIKVSSGEKVAEIKLEGMMVTRLYTSSSRLFAVGSDRVVVINWSGKISEDMTFTNLTYFAQNEDCFSLCHHPSGDNRQTVAISLNAKGKEDIKAEFTGNVNGICATSSRIYILSKNEIHSFDKKEEKKVFTVGYQDSFITACKGGVASIADMKIEYFK